MVVFFKKRDPPARVPNKSSKVELYKPCRFKLLIFGKSATQWQHWFSSIRLMSLEQNESTVSWDMSARSVIRIAAFPMGTTGKNTAEVKKPLSASCAAIVFAFSASSQGTKRIAVLVPYCSVAISLSNNWMFASVF
ncbi:hypothetical protein LVW35_06820 [Pseudomonas sp. HN11]|uniref:hypothetical protein n=1 Tax=Pseudomonas sp. HN11 TaxID=1344094 RepID=UPI001F3843DC|nr:hypothetical protein [Pseudomonas sp. HN11]UII72887.1 hypothetical protein LVW35_06820 [Pseudomonas sp. HN11]